MAHVLVVGLDKGIYKEIQGYIKKYKFNIQINREREVSRKDEKVNKDIYHIKHEVLLISMLCLNIIEDKSKTHAKRHVMVLCGEERIYISSFKHYKDELICSSIWQS